MNDTLMNNLSKLFESHRVVFWYDSASEFADVLDIMPSDVTLLRASEYNDFAIKYKLLSEGSEKKFLVYYEKDEPKYEDNWLLDIQLANTVFRTDKDSIILSDLNLPHSFIDIVRKHSSFFANKRLLKKLSTLIDKAFSEEALERQLLSVTVGEISYNLQNIVDALVIDEVENDGNLYNILKEYALNSVLWKEIASVYGYSKKEPSIEDFYLSVFETSLNHFIGQDELLSADAYGLLKHWKDSKRFKDSGLFSKLSEKAASELSAEKHLTPVSLEQLSTFDDYSFVEEEIITRLSSAVANQTMSLEVIRQISEKRKNSFWYFKYEDVYLSLVLGKTLLDAIRNISFSIDSIESGIRKYEKEWSHIDNAYRNFKFHVRTIMNINPYIETVADKVERGYINSFLIPLGEKWTPFAKQMLENGWKDGGIIKRQDSFINDRDIYSKLNKTIVIISDAMRYEIGEELISEINSQQRYKAQIQPMLASIPTYTQIGMATLLPHKKLSISPDGSAVYVDEGMSTQGMKNREKILKTEKNGRAICLGYDDIMKMKSEDLRTCIKDNSVMYIYHDLIDREGETNLIKASHEAIAELKDMIRKLGSSNANTIYVTADHGFIFQESDLEEHQYISEGTVKGKDVHQVSGRRCAIGYDLEPSDALMIAKVKDIGLSNKDDLEVAFPNSILRMRLHGANTNFVHGGLSLQEIIIPLIKVEKARKDDITDVSIAILTNLKTITTGSIAVTFFQEDCVSDKVQGYEATFGFYSQNGTEISDIEKRTVTSDSIDSKKREFRIVFYFNKESENYNRRPVYLRIQKIMPSGRQVLIKEKECILSRSMTSDFDF